MVREYPPKLCPPERATTAHQPRGLVLALASPAESKRFAAAHDGINPHDIINPIISQLGH
ncbi:MAG TPA: hypothetical protein VFW09_12885 [Solirubrobacteraceae bacterium]|nr:hypothetical protein [Solirubrobacteraceae bacterium]